MGADHNHEAADSLVARPIRRVLWVCVGLLAVLTGVALVLLWPTEPTPSNPVGEPTAGRVVATAECEPVTDSCLNVKVEVLEGPYAGETIRTDTFVSDSSPAMSVGTEVWLSESSPGSGDFGLSDINRESSLVWLAVIFAAVVILYARWKGLAALAGLASSLVLLIWFVLPAILLGANPVVVAAVGSAAIAIVAMGLAHGFHVGTAVAIVGTVLALILTLLLAWVFTGFTSLTGMGDENAYFLDLQGLNFDLRGLFLAGVVIGALGVLDDVTITQTAAVAEVKRAAPHTAFRELFGSGMRVGRDHVAATVNTLVLAYAGAALPTFILLTMSDVGLLHSMNAEILAQEIVRGLVGGLGIIAAVPITTALMAAVLSERHPHEQATVDVREPKEQLAEDFWNS